MILFSHKPPSLEDSLSVFSAPELERRCEFGGVRWLCGGSPHWFPRRFQCVGGWNVSVEAEGGGMEVLESQDVVCVGGTPEVA